MKFLSQTLLLVLFTGCFLSDTVFAQKIILNQQFLPSEITIRKGPDKRVTPDAERLAFAERLYATDNYEAVDEITTELLDNNSPLASEAQYLRGKALFAMGKVELTRRSYEWITIRHPDSKVMRDGRLAKTLSKSASYLLDKHQWQDAGKFMNLLQPFDENEVGRLGRNLEKQLDRELSEFITVTERREFVVTPESLRQLTQLGYNSHCAYQACYVEDDNKCQATIDDTIATKLQRLETGLAQGWQAKLGKWYGQQVKDFINQLAADAQAFPLLSQVVTEADFAAAVAPKRLPVISAPYTTSVEHTSGSWHRRSTDFNNTQYEGQKACVRTDPSKSAEIKNQLSLSFGRLDRNALLTRLGGLISLERQKPRRVGPKL